MRQILSIMRLIGFICALAVCMNMSAQKISVDRIENDGRHQIMTSSKDYSIDGAKYSISMKVYESSYRTDWCLLISSFYYIPSSAEVLLRLGNDELIYLQCNNVRVGQVTTPGYGIPIGSITYISPSKEVDYYSSIYELKPSDLDKIEEYGIKKIRISSGTSYRDKEFSSNTLGKFLKKCRRKIQERLDNPLEKKGLFDDF